MHWHRNSHRGPAAAADQTEFDAASERLKELILGSIWASSRKALRDAAIRDED